MKVATRWTMASMETWPGNLGTWEIGAEKHGVLVVLGPVTLTGKTFKKHQKRTGKSQSLRGELMN